MIRALIILEATIAIISAASFKATGNVWLLVLTVLSIGAAVTMEITCTDGVGRRR